MKLFQLCTVCICISVLSGCATQMSADQLRAMAQDKSALAVCGSWTNGLSGIAQLTVVNLDKDTVPAGTIQVNKDCSVTMTVDKAGPAAAALQRSKP